MPLITRIALIYIGAAMLLLALRAPAYVTPLRDGADIDVTGVLEATPTALQRTVPLHIRGKARVRVRVPDDAPALRMGQQVRVTGEWMTVRITQSAEPASEGLILARSVSAVAGGAHPLLRARANAQARLQLLFPTASPLAEALLIAQRENVNPQVKADFAASGLTHLLAISGTHVALVAAALLLMARLLRVSRSVAAAVSILGAAGYVFLLGAPFAALRALIQMTLVLASRSLQRPAHPLGLLSAAALALTVLDPTAPFDAGFQLSFAGIFGIILWRRPLIELQPASLPVPLRDAIATTIAATVTTTPIAAYHFGTVSVVSLLANLLAIPVVSLAVPTAAAALALSALDMGLGRAVAAGSELTLLWLNSIAHKCALVPGGHFNVTRAGIIASSLAVLVAYLLMRERPRSTLRGRMSAALLAACVPLLAAPVLPWTERRLEIHMIDVGQGDAIAIRSPRGRWLLVDAGPVSDRFNAGKDQVVPFLLRHNAARIDAVVISHPHLDHFGGLRAIAERIDVGAVVDPGMAVANPAFDSLLAASQRGHRPWLVARPRTRITLDDVAMEFLAPDTVPLDAQADANEYSAVFRLSYGTFSALFVGDLPSAAEQRLLERFPDRLDVDLLKVGHHGSGGSSGEDFLLAASPAVALVPVGRRNRYGHPHEAALARLHAVGARVFRTDEDGNVSVSVSADGRMSVRTRQ